MQEIALFLTGVAGVASAAACRRIPRGRRLATIGASPRMRGRVRELEVERDVLGKAIARLHSGGAGVPAAKRDGLLSAYQRRLGEVLAGIERLEEAGRHPDMGPVGDGLVELMDQKLSSLDRRLHEISARIAAAAPAGAGPRPEAAGPERAAPRRPAAAPARPAPAAPAPAAPAPAPAGPVEITTLTRIPGGAAAPPPALAAAPAPAAPAPAFRPPAAPEAPEGQGRPAGAPPPPAAPAAPTAGAPPPPAAPEPPLDGDEDDADGDDLDRIKGDIMRTLSKLEQAEVE